MTNKNNAFNNICIGITIGLLVASLIIGLATHGYGIKDYSKLQYQKGFEDGQNNLSYWDSEEAVIFDIINELKLMDYPKCAEFMEEWICTGYFEGRVLMLFSHNDSVNLYSNGTWTASWRDK